MTILIGWSDLLAFPAAAAEEENPSSRDGAFGDNDGDVNTVRSHMPGNCEVIRQGNFQQPEAEQVYPCGRHGIARAVKGLEHHHAIGIADIAVAQDAEAG